MYLVLVLLRAALIGTSLRAPVLFYTLFVRFYVIAESLIQVPGMIVVTKQEVGDCP